MAVQRHRVRDGIGRTVLVLALIVSAGCGPDGNCANMPDRLDQPQVIAEDFTITERAEPDWTRFSSDVVERQDDRATVQVTVEYGESSTDYIVRLRDVGLGDGFGGCSWEVTEIVEQ